MHKKSNTFSLLLLAGAGLVATGSVLPTPRYAAPVPAVAGIPLASQSFYDGSAMGLPMRLAVAGDRVIVLDALGTQTVHILDAETGALIESFGGRGEGPGEFEGPRSIDVDPSGDAFWIHDVAQQRSTLFPIESSTAESGRHREIRILKYAEGVGVIEPIHLGDREILAGGMFENGRLGHLDPEGRLVRASGELPPAPKGVPPHQIQFIHQGVLRGTPSRDRFALSSMFFTRVELFDRHGISRGFVEAPVELNPELRTSRRGEHRTVFVSSEAPAGYIDLAVTDEAIFALFSGRDPGVYGEDAGYADQVHVFAWTGDFVGALDLGYDAVAIAVSTDGKTLYTARHAPVVEIRRHELPGRM